MILTYGNKYIYNKEHTRQRTLNDTKARAKTMAYLINCESSLRAKNIPVPADWYEDIFWKLELR